MSKFYAVLIVFICFEIVNAWDSDDLEIFDLVEEVGQSFYELLEIPENANGSIIKKAFKKLSLRLHPDKNKNSEDANIKFRQLVAVYDVLRDATKRAKYDDVLRNGLPDWKEAVYYYRKVRKMGLIEMSVILFIIITIGQYLVAWAAYFEKKYALEEFVNLRSKKLQKRQKKGKAVDMETMQILPELVTALPKPTMACTLPVQICKLCWFLIIDGPPMTYHWVIRLYTERKKREQAAEEESSEEEVVPPVRERGPRRRKGFQVPEVKESEKKNQEPKNNSSKPKEEASKIISGGIWTDDDLCELIRLMKKFPQGTQERWEKIGDAMQRPQNEVAHMAHKLKDESLKPVSKQEEEKKEEEPKKVKTKGGKIGEDGVDEGVWSQVQQKAFEQALAAYPKGTVGDRWDKISKMVPGKTREECMLRYKSLVDFIKKKKEKPEN